MKMRWSYVFEQATSTMARQPSDVAPGGFPLLAGMDGRIEGCFRRYPGNLKYPDSTGTLNTGPATTAFTPSRVRPFSVPKDKGSAVTVDGVFVGDRTNGSLEIWYRESTDTAGQLRKQSLDAAFAPGGLMVKDLSAMGSATSTSLCGGIDPEATITFGSDICVHWMRYLTYQNQTNLFVVGNFRRLGGRNCFGVAKWTGKNWEPVGDLLNDQVYDICVFNGDIIIGGSFTYGSGLRTIRRLAILRNGRWEELSGGMNNTVSSLATHTISGAETLYVGGSFTTAGTGLTVPVSSPYLAKLSTAGAWTTTTVAGNSFNGTVYDMVVFDDGSSNLLYVGGAFTNTPAGAATSSYLGTYNTSGTFATFTGGAPNASVFCLGTDSSGYLLIGGNFTTIGGSATPVTAKCTKWNGLVCSTIATGSVTGLHYVNDIFHYNGSVYIASINTAGTGNVIVGYATLGGAWAQSAIEGTTSNTSQVEACLEKVTLNGTVRLLVGGTIDRTITTGYASPYLLTACGSAVTWDICTRGTYIYLLASNGYHLTLKYNGASNNFTVLPFGPELLGCQTGIVTPSFSGGFLPIGGYQLAYRFYDKERARWTGLSGRTDPSVGILTSSGGHLYFPGSISAFSSAPPVSYVAGNTEIFCTVCSGVDALADPVPGGGFLHRVGRGSISRAYGLIGADVGLDDDEVDDGAGYFTLRTTDANIGAADLYDELKEYTAELGRCFATAHFQGMTFTVEDRDGNLDIRWSPPWRLEPENFPPVNVFATRIPTSLGTTCRFVVAGDFLFLVGGDRVYRLQKAGDFVGVVEIAAGYPVLHADGIVALGTTVYIPTEQGLMRIDARSGGGDFMDAAAHLFRDRWRGQLTPGSETACLRAAYDSRMECLYFHHVGLEETLCLWLSTGKMTMLLYNPFYNLVDMPDWDTQVSRRAYWISTRKQLFVPNWDRASTVAQTMNGNFIYTSTSGTYNRAVTAVSTSGSYTRLSFTTGAPHAFTSDGTTAIDVGPMYVFVQYTPTGASAGNWYRVQTNGASYLDILTADLAAADIAIDAVVSLAPVALLIVGSALWDSAGRIDPDSRKIISTGMVVARRVNSPAVGATSRAQTTPDPTWSVLRQGTSRGETYISDEPRSTAGVPRTFCTLTKASYHKLGAALDTDKPSNNYARFVSGTDTSTQDGTTVHPVLMSGMSNISFELHQVAFDGDGGSSLISGPGTV